MLYALLGDLHSNIEDTKAVLAHIQQTAEEATIIGLGIYMNALLVRKRHKPYLAYLCKKRP